MKTKTFFALGAFILTFMFTWAGAEEPPKPTPPRLALAGKSAARAITDNETPAAARSSKSDDDKAKKKRVIAIALGVTGGLMLAGGAVTLGLVFGLPRSPTGTVLPEEVIR